MSGAACTTAGETCSGSQTLCGASTAEQCTCAGGAWSCPPLTGDQCVTPTCPPASQISYGGACNLSSQGGCTVAITGTACGMTYTDTCACQPDSAGAGTWACTLGTRPECKDSGPPGCPNPSFIAPGDSCSASPQLTCSTGIPLYDCAGNFLGDESCQCFDGTWSCETPVDCPDAAACPDPQSVQEGALCPENGLQCPGNPQVCDGAVFYDAFQCEGGAWIDVAVTGCATDGGGPVDAGPVDAGGFGG